jgi:hypothetical protein
MVTTPSRELYFPARAYPEIAMAVGHQLAVPSQLFQRILLKHRMISRNIIYNTRFKDEKTGKLFLSSSVPA